jgi:hypothetical protein
MDDVSHDVAKAALEMASPMAEMRVITPRTEEVDRGRNERVKKRILLMVRRPPCLND